MLRRPRRRWSRTSTSLCDRIWCKRRHESPRPVSARTGSVGGTVWFQSERARPVSLAGWSSCCALRVAGRVVWARASRHDTRPRSWGHGARSDYSTRRNNFHPKTQLSWLARLSQCNTADPEALICGSLCMLVVDDDATLPLVQQSWILDFMIIPPPLECGYNR